jgi:hypothetical protein
MGRTLAELRSTATAADWPSRNLARRAARLATDGAVYPLLLRIADKHYLRRPVVVADRQLSRR